MKTTYIECDCHNEVLVVTPDAALEEIYLAIWGPRTRKPGWRTRLRFIWNIIRTGQPYEDQFVLNKEGARTLRATITAFLHKLDSK